MSANTSIEWTDRTWNPVRGCSRVSPGCDHCYAMGFAHRFAGPGKPYDGLTTIRKGKVDWTGVARFIPGELETPLRWRKPQRIFVNSMSDLFHRSLSNEEIAAVFGVMAAARKHTFQVLTKRPERMLEWFAWVDALTGGNWIVEGDTRTVRMKAMAEDALRRRLDVTLHPSDPLCFKAISWPLPNVWLGVSVENQKAADERIPLLLRTPAAVRFISAEPLLGPLSFRWAFWAGYSPGWRERGDVQNHLDGMRGIDWVITGGESGPGARPCALEWLESLVDQCREAGAACFVKQLGAVVVSEQRACDSDEEAKRDFGFSSRWLWRAGLKNRKGGDTSEWPDNLRVRQFPRSA